MAGDGDEKNGPGGDEESFDHTALETLGHAIRDAGRGLVAFGTSYKYLDPDERQVRRQTFGRLVALINSLWPFMDGEIKADARPPVTSHERDAHRFHVDRLFRALDVISKPPKKDD